MNRRGDADESTADDDGRFRHGDSFFHSFLIFYHHAAAAAASRRLVFMHVCAEKFPLLLGNEEMDIFGCSVKLARAREKMSRTNVTMILVVFPRACY